MKIVGISDIHGNLIDCPECDVLCIAGDIFPLDIQRRYVESVRWMRYKFVPWVESLPCKKVILVAGNHDFLLDSDYSDPLIDLDSPSEFNPYELSEKLIYLDKKMVEIDGVTFYGDPTCTGPRGWAFYRRDEHGLFDSIPNCDVLITHQPPYGKVSTVLQEDSFNHGRNYGAKSLTDRLQQGGVKYCLSGHIHSGLHTGEKIGECMCYNVSIKDERYVVSYNPFILEI